MDLAKYIGKSLTCSECGMPQFETPSGLTCKNGHGGAPTAEEAPDKGRLDEIEFMRLQANRGWIAERRYDELRNFIRARGLYADLVAFVRKIR